MIEALQIDGNITYALDNSNDLQIFLLTVKVLALAYHPIL